MNYDCTVYTGQINEKKMETSIKAEDIFSKPKSMSTGWCTLINKNYSAANE